jgi:class 3 adenylate cyclase
MAELSSEPRAVGPSSVQGASVKGERRIVTVLFADVVNSTGLAETLDPEDWTELMNGAFGHMTGPVRRYEGTVGRLMGDGILAFFGAPTSHEDDPQRAVLAGLEIVAAVKTYAQSVRETRGLPFEVRVGINTGFVVVADVGSAALTELTAMGDAVNVAARMQSTAQPGTVQIAAETYRLVSQQFDTLPLGKIELKGKAEPLEAYQVIGLRSDPIRFRDIHEVVAPLIGRDHELAILKDAIDGVQQGRGQIICIIGEAGLGKSRLLSEAHDYWLRTQPDHHWEALSGVPFDTGRPFGLFQNYARSMFGVELNDPNDIVHRKVQDRYKSMGAPPEAWAMCAVAMERVIAAKVLHEAKDYPAEAIKADIHDNMIPAFRQTADEGPLVVVLEDLHWSDDASVDLILDTLKLVEEHAVLIICAFRPERQSPAWKVKIAAETNFPHRYAELSLKQLDAECTDALVAALLNIHDFPDELRTVIMRKTEGNPYFIEEVVRTLIEQGAVTKVDGHLAWSVDVQFSDLTIPDTLQALLMARMDRLDQETRITMQMASVIGRQFYYRILRAISDSAMTVDKHIHSLERVELLREAGRKPELEYVFKHELARDAAYATILNRKRREFHKRVAEAMEQIFTERIEDHAHRLGQHFELGGEDARAAHYYEIAGDAAAAIGAGVEANAQFGRAIEAARRGGLDAAKIAALEGKRLSRAA